MHRTKEHNQKISDALKRRGASSKSKICPRCKLNLDRDQFKVRLNGSSHSYCIPCELSYGRERTMRYYLRHPEKRAKQRENNRKALLKRHYSMTPECYDSMFKNQDGKCAICKHPERAKRRRLVVDHDHESGVVRALLCSHCNSGLGMFRENVDSLKAAISYIEYHLTKKKPENNE